MATKGTTDQQMVGELERVLFAIEAVVAHMEDHCNGTIGKPNNELHGLQMAVSRLVDYGLKLSGAH